MDKNIKTPDITVFMACYNAQDFVSEAISSVLNQTFTNFELLIVNDGSTDDSVKIINSFNDDRIKLIHNQTNQGLVYTRNTALTHANGKYIAVLDSDDIAYPNRLKLQYDYLESNPTVALCGGHAAIIDSDGIETGEKLIVLCDENLNMQMMFGNPFVNSSTMFRAIVLRELNGYNKYALAEDYDLFLRFAEKYLVSNIDHFLVKYRIHNHNITTIKANEMLDVEWQIINDIHNRLALPQNNNILKAHFNLFTYQYQKSNFEDYRSLLIKLKNNNIKTQKFPLIEFESLLFSKWYEVIYHKNAGKHSLKLLFNKDLFKWRFLTFKQFRRVFKRSLRGVTDISVL
jgi:glycosyltransferase involved in cell wall biosynthesis